jgi:hypothetical protein
MKMGQENSKEQDAINSDKAARNGFATMLVIGVIFWVLSLMRRESNSDLQNTIITSCFVVSLSFLYYHTRKTK